MNYLLELVKLLNIELLYTCSKILFNQLYHKTYFTIKSRELSVNQFQVSMHTIECVYKTNFINKYIYIYIYHYIIYLFSSMSLYLKTFCFWWAYVPFPNYLVGFFPVGLCPVGFCPVGFCPVTDISFLYAYMDEKRRRLVHFSITRATRTENGTFCENDRLTYALTHTCSNVKHWCCQEQSFLYQILCILKVYCIISIQGTLLF